MALAAAPPAGSGGTDAHCPRAPRAGGWICCDAEVRKQLMEPVASVSPTPHRKVYSVVRHIVMRYGGASSDPMVHRSIKNLDSKSCSQESFMLRNGFMRNMW